MFLTSLNPEQLFMRDYVTGGRDPERGGESCRSNRKVYMFFKMYIRIKMS